jgi:organic radical activating enzyme
MSNEQKIFILKQKVDTINAVSPSFCTAKWLQTTLYLQNGYNHSCHHPSPHKIPISEVENNPAALHNSKFKKLQRTKMLSGERPSECSYCWKIEDLDTTYFSDRHYKTADTWAWDRFEEISKSAPTDDVVPSYLEVSFSNACNLKCSYCSPEISSKWLEEIKQWGPYPTSQGSHDLTWLKETGRFPYKHSDDNPYVTAFWKWFPKILPSLKVFRITGGEPLMSKDTWKAIDFIIETNRSPFEIAINSNLCVDDKLIDRLIEQTNKLTSLGHTVNLFTSLESTGIKAEYSRFGLDFTKWKSNLHRVLSETTATIGIMTTVNVLSITDFNNFIDCIMEYRVQYNHNLEHNRIPLSINYLKWPPYLNVSILPKDSRVLLSQTILAHCEQWLKYFKKDTFARIYLEEWDQINRLCEYLTSCQEDMISRGDFVKFVTEYDHRRNLNFSKTFPELAPIVTIDICQN